MAERHEYALRETQAEAQASAAAHIGMHAAQAENHIRQQQAATALQAEHYVQHQQADTEARAQHIINTMQAEHDRNMEEMRIKVQNMLLSYRIELSASAEDNKSLRSEVARLRAGFQNAQTVAARQPSPPKDGPCAASAEYRQLSATQRFRIHSDHMDVDDVVGEEDYEMEFHDALAYDSNDNVVEPSLGTQSAIGVNSHENACRPVQVGGSTSSAALRGAARPSTKQNTEK